MFAVGVVCRAGLSLGSGRLPADDAHTKLREQAASTMREAACFFRTKAASHGGYVYIASEVFSRNIETLCQYLTATAGN